MHEISIIILRVVYSIYKYASELEPVFYNSYFVADNKEQAQFT